MRSSLHAWLSVGIGLGACGGDGDRSTPSQVDASIDSGDTSRPDADTPDVDEPALVIDRAALRSLRYDASPAPADPSNRFAEDPAALAFGKTLFFDPAFSGPLLEGDNDGGPATLGLRGQAGRVSCAGCHVASANFVDTRSPHRQISLAAGWTQRRTPTLLEVAFAPLLNWDGAHDTLWSQALGVMENAKEFNSGRLFVAQQTLRNHRARYEALFGPLPALDDAARFPQLTPEQAGCREQMTRQGVVQTCRGKPGDGADYDKLAEADQSAVTRVAVNVAKALSAYVRALRCGPGRFDAWLDGDDDALDAAEQRGAALFAGKAQCTDCHSGPRFSDGQFHNIGLSPAQVAVAFIDANDQGAATGVAAALASPLNSRGAFSDGDRGTLPSAVTPKLMGAFRTPSLRCIADQPSFMHTGQLRTLEQVIAFHDRGGDPPGGYPGSSELTPLGLSEGERADLAAFLRTLSGPGADASLRTP